MARRKSQPKSPTPQSEPANPLISLEQTLALLKTSRQTLYRWLRQGRLKGNKLGRQWRFFRQDIEAFLKGTPPRVDLPVDIGPLIDELSQRIKAAGQTPIAANGGGKLKHAIDLMVQLGVCLRASDIHLDPQPDATGNTRAVLRYRIDGALHVVAEIDLRLLPGIIEQWKRMASCDPNKKHRPQDGRILTGGHFGRQLDLRVCFLPALLGEAMTARLLDPAALILDLDRMDLPQAERGIVDWAVDLPNGMVVAVGPTGSGKTTLLYSCLKRTINPATKVLTIEDPVEYLIPGAVQVAINPAAGLTFARAIRAVLRSDPDVLLVGEIRDLETLQLCFQTALTGHLVFTTLHTDEAAAALKRMVDIGTDPFLVADATQMVMATRLVRKLCPACSVPAKSGQFLERAERIARVGGAQWNSMDRDFREPVGCDKCARMGYRGRQLLLETLRVTPEIGAALRRGASVEELRRIAVSEGMTTLPAGGVRLAGQGVTSLSEVMRVWRT